MHNLRPEVANDVVSCVVVGTTGVDVRAKDVVILGQTVLDIYDCLG